MSADRPAERCRRCRWRKRSRSGEVPAGTYTVSLRAENASGVSVSSNPVTLTFPGPCSGAPLAPTGFVASKDGSEITVVWERATSGPAATAFVLNVTGAFVRLV